MFAFANSLSDAAMKAVARNLTKSYTEADAKAMMIQKYPYLEGEIVNMFEEGYKMENIAVNVESTNAAVMSEKIDDTFDEDAELDVSGIVDAAEEALASVEEKTPVVQKNAMASLAAEVAASMQEKTAKVAKEPKTVNAARKPRANSNASKARAMYAEASDKSRAVLVPLFVEQLGMTQSVAVSYWYTVKREFDKNK